MPKAKKKYVDVSVAAELLVELKQKQNDAPGGAMEKYGRFKNWLRYANLKGWQEQKWHWGYVNYCGPGMALHVWVGDSNGCKARSWRAGAVGARCGPRGTWT
jgi:hypothetical protein